MFISYITKTLNTIVFVSCIGNKQLDQGEFVAGFKSAFGGTDAEAKKAFAKLDADGSGEITVDEISAFFKQMDKDGQIYV